MKCTKAVLSFGFMAGVTGRVETVNAVGSSLLSNDYRKMQSTLDSLDVVWRNHPSSRTKTKTALNTAWKQSATTTRRVKRRERRVESSAFSECLPLRWQTVGP